MVMRVFPAGGTGVIGRRLRSTASRRGVRDRDGKVISALALDIRSVTNPGKLGHAGPVADNRALMREAFQARQPKD